MVLIHIVLQCYHAAIQRPHGMVGYFRIRRLMADSSLPVSAATACAAASFCCAKVSRLTPCTVPQHFSLLHRQRIAAAQHFFPIGCQVGKGLVALVVLRLPDHHLTLQVLLGLFQFLNMLL